LAAVEIPSPLKLFYTSAGAFDHARPWADSPALYAKRRTRTSKAS
jgi:hypothetical protein